MKRLGFFVLFISLIMIASPLLATTTKSFNIAEKRLIQIKKQDQIVLEGELSNLVQDIANEGSPLEIRRQEINRIINLTLSLFYKRDSIQEASSLLERPRDLINDLTKKIRFEALKRIARKKRLEEQRQKELLIKGSEARERKAKTERVERKEAKKKVIPRKKKTIHWKELSGNIWTGIKVYQGAGDNKSLAFEVLGGSTDCKRISSGRGLYVRYGNGSKEWKDRNVMIKSGFLFVKKDDPALNRMQWETYNFC